MAAGRTHPHSLLPTHFLSLPTPGGEGGLYFIGPGTLEPRKPSHTPGEAPLSTSSLQQLQVARKSLGRGSRLGQSCPQEQWATPGTSVAVTTGGLLASCGWGPGCPQPPQRPQRAIQAQCQSAVPKGREPSLEKCPQQKFPTDLPVQLKEKGGGPDWGPVDEEGGQ